ncbi:MAG TPA: hypothetical protein VNE82_01655 [Candidatus Binataceae bacterium]|nr:hypothetical protein [Candidatus Binataceae bacterium]
MIRAVAGVIGALTLAAAMVALGRAPAHARSFAAGPAQSRRSANTRIVHAEDAGPAPNSFGDDPTPSVQDIARRRGEYTAAFAISAGILLIAIVLTFALRRRAATAAGIAALGALGMGAFLQFTASKGLPMFLWPPLHLWLGTFAANFMLAVMFAAIGGTLLRPGMRRVMGSILIAEIAWWGIPAFVGAAGLTLGIARQRMDMDWLVFLGTAVGAVAAPAAGWATAALSAALAERMLPGRT